MSRKAPPPPDASVLGKRREPLFEVKVHVVTPLFGGSANTGEVDSELPIRAASIRGHLRFWWRACKGADYSSCGDLFKKEKSIWGSVKEPGAIEIVTQVESSGKRVPYKSMPKCLSYALFPFRGEASKKKEPADALEGVCFKLLLFGRYGNDLDKLKKEAEAALWAWLTFGGIGARTRRGCGSLFCSDSAFRPNGDVGEWLKQKASSYVTGSQGQTMIPLLLGAQILWGSESSISDAWSNAVKVMEDFRQGVGFARNKGSDSGRPGRSRWPEADSIREIEKKWDFNHTPKHPARPFYPRADLGLPIVFHFQSKKDPSDHTLEAACDGATRMASPIILKPLALSENNAVPMVVVLNAPHVWDSGVPGVRFQGQQEPIPLDQLNNPQKAEQTQPLKQFSAQNARDAFVEFVKKEKRFKGEVRL
ncbi:MAG: type III-B CRISPR module RAMP protein Cmr1 [Armatimonadota bacterium]